MPLINFTLIFNKFILIACSFLFRLHRTVCSSWSYYPSIHIHCCGAIFAMTHSLIQTHTRIGEWQATKGTKQKYNENCRDWSHIAISLSLIKFQPLWFAYNVRCAKHAKQWLVSLFNKFISFYFIIASHRIVYIDWEIVTGLLKMVFDAVLPSSSINKSNRTQLQCHSFYNSAISHVSYCLRIHLS